MVLKYIDKRYIIKNEDRFILDICYDDLNGFYYENDMYPENSSNRKNGESEEVIKCNYCDKVIEDKSSLVACICKQVLVLAKNRFIIATQSV